MNPNDSINKDSTTTSNELVDLSQVLLDATKTNYQIVNDPASSHLIQQPNIATATGTTASPYIIQNGNIYQLTANNQLISRNTIQLNQIVSSNTQQNEVLLQTTPVNLQSTAPKQIIINQPNQNNRIRMTTIKNGSTFLNLNTKGKVIYRTTNTTTNNDPITTSSPLLASNLTSTPQIRTINIQQPTTSKQIIISNGTANNTSRLSTLINNNNINKPQPSIIVLAPNSNASIQQQQKPITLKSVIEQPSLKPINSIKPLSVTKIQSLNDSNQQLQYYLSNSPATSTQFLNDSNSNQLIKSLISNDKPHIKLDSFISDDLIKQEDLDAEFNQKSIHPTVQSDLNSLLLDNNTFAKTKNHKEMVKITPIAVQPKSANIIQSILNRPVTFVTNNIPQPQTIVTQPQKIPQTKPAQLVQTVQLNNEVKNQPFIKIAAKKEANLQPQQQMIQQQLNQQVTNQSIPQKQLEIDENIMPNDSCLNDLLLPDTRIFASLLNKDSNGAVAAASASASKDPNSKKRVLTDLTYKTVLIGNSEHIILDNVQNLADFRGDFTKLQNLATAVANRFNKPVTIPAFLLIDNKFSLDKVKECLNEKNIHPIIIETAANQTQSTQQQQKQTAKPTQTNQQNPEHFKEQNHYIIQTLNKQTPAVEEQQQLPPAQIIIKKTTAANKRNKNESACAKSEQPVQKKPRKQKAAKATTAKYLSSLTTGSVSESESANNTPNKIEQHLNPVNSNINVSNLSVNQILKLDQQQYQHLQQQDQNSTQILNNFISEQMIMSNNQQIIANELEIKNYNYQIVDNNMQLQQQQLPIQIEQTHNIVYVQQDQQLDQSNQAYVIQQNCQQQLQVNQQQQVDQQLFANPNTEYDFTTFDPFDSNALFNLNEMEFI